MYILERTCEYSNEKELEGAADIGDWEVGQGAASSNPTRGDGSFI